MAVSTVARVGLTVFLVLAAAATVFGLVRYWPDDTRTPNQVASTDFAAPGVTFPIAEVQTVLPPARAPTPRRAPRPPTDSRATSPPLTPPAGRSSCSSTSPPHLG